MVDPALFIDRPGLGHNRPSRAEKAGAVAPPHVTLIPLVCPMRFILPSTACSCSRVRPALGAPGLRGGPKLCSGCAVVAVADAAVTVVSTTVKVGATVVGTTVTWRRRGAGRGGQRRRLTRAAAAATP